MTKNRLLAVSLLSGIALTMPTVLVLDCPKGIFGAGAWWMFPPSVVGILTVTAVIAAPVLCFLRYVKKPDWVTGLLALVFLVAGMWVMVDVDFDRFSRFSQPMTALRVLSGAAFCDAKIPVEFRWGCAGYLYGFLVRLAGLVYCLRSLSGLRAILRPSR